ncbi:putative ubiquitin-like-specific protease 1B [Gastrolobium bilobum]|uniref:putative ubiquitin-like-specific protease 1B n=1 Tax=Gastrolobium bilobum TaxID=150636 RepID=UPI002AB1E49B|nr:putative ubiquitin-like-specific protease 1B [Gastrolobium bilobum]
MAVITSNGKRPQHCLTVNHNYPSKRPRLSRMTHNHTESTSMVSRISRYPEAKQPFNREIHAPFRPRKFDFSTSSSFKPSGGYGYSNNENVRNDIGGCVLFKNHPRDSHKDAVSQDSGVEEVHFIEEHGRELRSVAEGHHLDAKVINGGLQQQSTSSVVSELSNSNLNVVSAAKVFDTLSLSPEYDLSSVHAYRKLLETVVKRTDKINRLSLEIQLTEKLKSTFNLLLPKKELIEEVPSVPFVPLTKEEEDEVACAFSANRKKVLVTHEKSNIEISGENFQCLRPHAWLNNEVINLYLELLKERERREPHKFLNCHFFNTFFYIKLINGKNGYDFNSVRRWTSKKKLGYGLHECDKIFVPIHKEIHWCLAVINTKDKKFQYLDSLKGMDTQVLKVLARYFVDEVKDKTGKDIDVSSWEKEFVEDLPEQENGYDCGVFMIKYTDFYSRNLGLCFNQEHMPYFRRKTAKEILRLKAD